ncbi:MAG: CheR family methyltransferase [Methanobacteriota archaeon]
MSADSEGNLLTEFSDILAIQTGLHFPKERYKDLERGLSGATKEFGYADTESCLKQLLTQPLTRDQIKVLAMHLTVGETYFFRDTLNFDFLREKVLPTLIQSRGETRRIRIWSAGCSSGEEPYSVAILLDQVLQKADDWTISILATDINPTMLARARDGIYGAWSFRDVSDQIRKDNFVETGKNTWKINERAKRRVTFQFHNLMEDPFPSIINETNAMDLILCRNVLMYLSPESSRKIVLQFANTLTEGGWLIVSQVEISQITDPRLIPLRFYGQTFFRKSDKSSGSPIPVVQEPEQDLGIPTYRPVLSPVPAYPVPGYVLSVPSKKAGITLPAVPAVSTNPEQLIDEGRYAEAVRLLEDLVKEDPSHTRIIVLLVRAYASLGNFDLALKWCEQGIASDNLNPLLHYLHAIILEERGDVPAGLEALRRTLYLDPDFILAHIALGSSALKKGKGPEANRHFSNAKMLLERLSDDDLVPESGGLTAERLLEFLTHAGGAAS